jgi:hypothetical protein
LACQLDATAALGVASLVISVSAASEEADAAQSDAALTTDAAPDMANMSRRERRAALRQAESAAKAQSDATDEPATQMDEVLVVGSEPEQECRRVRPTGSRMATVVCTPVAQATAEAERHRQEAQDVLRRQEENATRAPIGPLDPSRLNLPTGF